ncbi:MAG: hypothetical protein WDN31_05285 [Hyphomicrobium sp.]
MPDLPQLIRELRLLERRTHRSGKDTVDHGSGGSDDYANVLSERSTTWSAAAWVTTFLPRSSVHQCPMLSVSVF